MQSVISTTHSHTQLSQNQEKIKQEVKKIGLELIRLKNLFNGASFLVTKHRFSKLNMLERTQIALQHDIFTFSKLVQLNLVYADLEENSYSWAQLYGDLEKLKTRLKHFKAQIFSKKIANTLL